MVEDKAFAKVDLPKLEDAPIVKLEKKNLQHYRIEGGGSGWMLESFASPGAKRVFLDLDTGRVAGVPERWRKEGDLSAKFAEVEAWAKEEGFDLMGAEYLSPVSGKSHYALRPLEMEFWELGEDRWKMESADITFESLISEGKSSSGWLLHRDQEKQQIEPEEIATLLFRTEEGTPGLLFVGVEVHDDSQQSGGLLLADDDLELKRVGFAKGRRFGYRFFEELEEKK